MISLKNLLTNAKVIVASFLLALSSMSANADGGVSNAVSNITCSGKLFNPISDTDWNTIYPITVMGIKFTSGSNTGSPLMDMMPPICVCPTYVFGIPFFGIGITYWQPAYISEIERRPGCFSSIGGLQLLKGFSTLGSESTGSGSVGGGGARATNRMQVHWYEYPVMSILEIFTDIICRNSKGFALAYVTEIDALWQDDLWGAMFSPESALFASPPAQFVCAIDAIASSFNFTLDPLFWCAGSWGSVYPFSGNTSHTGDAFQFNNLIQAKFIARNHRVFVQMQTTGPSAICFSHPNPIWIKSQYRYNQVGPITRKGKAVTTGDMGRTFTWPPVTNVPTQEHTINLIWQGQQCCARF